MEVLVFGGTSEGRELATWLTDTRDCAVTYVTATAYGASLPEEGPRLTTVIGPLTHDEKRGLVSTHDYRCIVDATHPYATHISQSIDALARECGIEVIHIDRPALSAKGHTVCQTPLEAARRLAKCDGNILLTTGASDLAVYAREIPAYRDRLFVRILPLQASLARAEEAGIPPSHLIAMQGPFSAELNAALFREFRIAHLVTKQAGRRGGFEEKLQAAREVGVDVLVIERPHHVRDGVSLKEAERRLEVNYGC